MSVVAIIHLDPAALSRAALLEEQDIDVVEHEDPEAFRHSAKAQPAAVVFLSRRSGRRVLQAVAQVRGEHLDAPLIVVCDRIGGTEARALLAAGVTGLVLSRDCPRALIPTIKAVTAGQVCVPQRHASYAERPGLSTREKQAIGLVALGLSNGEIASLLFVAESTVKSHLSSAFVKLGVRSRDEAVELIVNPAFGLSNGIMSLGAEPIVVGRDPARNSEQPMPQSVP